MQKRKHQCIKVYRKFLTQQSIVLDWELAGPGCTVLGRKFKQIATAVVME
jgi:hypothetical protein